MPDWLRFWDKEAWLRWRSDRETWKPIASERRSLRRQVRDTRSSISELQKSLATTERHILWAHAILPREVPIKTARGEIGLAVIPGITLLEWKGRGKDAKWTPVGRGEAVFTDRKLVFDGHRQVEFRFSDLERADPHRAGLEIKVGRRKRAHRLAGPVEQLLFTLDEANAWDPDTPPEARHRRIKASTEAEILALNHALDGLNETLTDLDMPARPISPAWLPGAAALIVIAVLANAGGGDNLSAAAVAGEATTSPTTSTAPTTTIVASTTTVAPTTTLPDGWEHADLVSVTDGDTIRVRLSDGSVEPLRLIGLNAPEPGECWAQEANDALAALLTSEQLLLESDVNDRDQYDRLLRYVYIGDTFVNAELVRAGGAVSQTYAPDTKHQGELDSAETEAVEESIGIWSGTACGGDDNTGVLTIAALGYNPPGDDNAVLTEEWVAFRNAGPTPVELAGWSVKDESSSHRYQFPDVTLAPGALVVLHTGCGANQLPHLYWCETGSAVWNNGGDTVFLLDPNGNSTATLPYSSDRPSDTLESIGFVTPTTTTTTAAATTTASQATTTTAASNCDPSYPTVCIPPRPPDLDCPEIPFRNFTVVGSDPHGFDGDNDGVGCET